MRAHLRLIKQAVEVVDFAESRNEPRLMGRKLWVPGLFGTTEGLGYPVHSFIALQFAQLQFSLLFAPVINQVCSI